EFRSPFVKSTRAWCEAPELLTGTGGKETALLTVYGCIVNDHDPRLLGLAVVVCVLTSFFTISLLQHARTSNGNVSLGCIHPALSAGFGIWSTHFIAMLAFSPGIPSGYDMTMTFLSLIVAVCVTYAGFFVALMPRGNAGLGGAIVGCGIAAMHYLGAAAFEVEGRIGWDANFVGVSIAVGILGGAAALPVALRGGTWRWKFLATLFLILAICALHFTAMAAISITPDPTVNISDSAVVSDWLAGPIGAAGIISILLALFSVAVRAYRVGTTVVLGAALLIACVVGTNTVVLGNLRDNSLRSAETDLARHSLMLSEQTDRSFQSVDLVLSRVGDYLGRRGAKDAESYHRIVPDQDTHLFLQEKIIGLAQVE